MAINGTDSTSLNVNDGATINIQSSSSNAGAVYFRSSITFNNVMPLIYVVKIIKKFWKAFDKKL